MEEGEESGGIRYGRIPQRVPRRYKTMRQVDLFRGNLVLDCPVPSKLLEQCPNKTNAEFTSMRYTAATCEPDHFADELYELRQSLYQPNRKTELFICLTMYNEDELLFTRTMHHVMQNVAHLCSRHNSKTWGENSWKKVVVCIVSDGRRKINSRTLAVLAAMGVYQEGVAKNVVNGKQVTAHIYEYTAQVSIDEKLRVRSGDKFVPVQILFCLKERNQKKINSHRWFFNAFGKVLEPNVCILIDVGTMPRNRSIYHLWKAFDANKNVGGACGEIVALKGKMWKDLLNPLVGSQNFEYKMSNILDKPLESAFGYITVLPGAFSAYRYCAVQNDATGEGPLKEYFKGEAMHGGESDVDIFTSNMYLAEDRILCWELVSKRGSQWLLHYVKSAQGVTDVPDTVDSLIGQRRRWLNGSFFASLHSICKFFYIYRSGHSFGRKVALHIEMIYQAITLFFSFFSLSNFFIAFWILTRAVSQEVKQMEVPNVILTYVYLAVVLFCFLLSLGNRPAGNKWAYLGAMIIFAILTAYMTAAAIALAILSIKDLKKEDKSLGHSMVFIDVVVSFASTYGIWLLASILALDPAHMFTSLLSYILLAPSMINVINVYAFSNTHDVSWGTKGSDTVSTDLGVAQVAAGGKVEVTVPVHSRDLNAAYDDALNLLSSHPPPEEPKVDREMKQKDYYAMVRTNVLLAWVILNIALAVCILNIGGDKVKMTYMGVLLWSVAALAAFKFCGQLYYLVGYLSRGA